VQWSWTLTHILILSMSSSALSPLYMAEISPPEVRGSLMALEQFSIVLGVVCGFWTGFLTRNSKVTRHISFHVLILWTVPSSLSWRIPLYIQLIPGLVLALGTLILPPSPRLLVLQGNYDGALSALATLRSRPAEDPLLEVELMEMKVEAIVVQRAFGAVEDGKEGWARELSTWKKLFEKKYRDRTAVGVLMAFFQRMSALSPGHLVLTFMQSGVESMRCCTTGPRLFSV